MNTLAIGFAAFAAWYALKPKAGTASPSIADAIFGTAAAQRREVGNATAANTDYINSLTTGTKFAADFTSQYAKRQGVAPTSNIVGGIDFGAAAYSFNPSYALS
jgi:hypothetical protein